MEAGEGYTPGQRQREKGADEKESEKDPTLLSDLEGLLEPKGDPMSLLKWTCKSVAHLKGALHAMGHTIADTALRDVLLSLGYRLVANKKNLEGSSHQDRDAQFAQIKQKCDQFERVAIRSFPSTARKRTYRHLQEQRAGVASQRRGDERQCVRLSFARRWQSYSVRHL